MLGAMSLTEAIPEGADSWLSADCTAGSWGNKSLTEEKPGCRIPSVCHERQGRRQTENKSLSFYVG